VLCTNKVHDQKVGAVGAKLDGKQMKMISAAPTYTNICAFLVLDKTEPHAILPPLRSWPRQQVAAPAQM